MQHGIHVISGWVECSVTLDMVVGGEHFPEGNSTLVVPSEELLY